MAEEEQQRSSTERDEDPGQTQTQDAVDLAGLLYYECTQLLHIYKEKEPMLKDHTPNGGRIVSLSQDPEEPSTEQQVQMLHAALRQCLGLLHCLILKEEEEWGELEGDYATVRTNVRSRLQDLLYITKSLLETEDSTLEVTPDHQCNEEVDGFGEVFALKLWTHRVLLELIHWADHAKHTLHVLHQERGGGKEKI
uniref:Ciliary neurotrophic factor n=1 Tax=Gouania willdenowi TaxID=441366 RepID=A0A8C5GQ94_GOUWI